MESTANTLNQLVTFLTEEKRENNNAVNEILLSNHPAMDQIKKLLGIPYRVFFINKSELSELLVARGFKEVESNPFSEDQVWEQIKKDKKNILTFLGNLFNSENKLKVLTKDEWNSDFIQLKVENIDEYDDLPF